MKKEIKNDILQYAIDIRSPIDERTIQEVLEDAGIEVIGICWKAAWTDEGYWKYDPPYSSD